MRESFAYNILKSRPLSDKEFREISSLVYERVRINLHDGKKELVQSRLNKRLRLLGMETFQEYIDYAEADPTGDEIRLMVDMLTTNLTYFFRENDHYEFLVSDILKKTDFRNIEYFRIWSAGCSSGEEPYTLAMLLREHVPGINLINALTLGTDVSDRMLAIASRGVYDDARLEKVPSMLRDKYFTRLKEGRVVKYKVKPDLQRLTRFRRHNLMDQWQFTKKFDVVFCRNVMIYFDKKTQADLVNRFYDVIRPGGYFMVGHSESLSGVDHKFSYIKPMIYKRPES